MNDKLRHLLKKHKKKKKIWPKLLVDAKALKSELFKQLGLSITLNGEFYHSLAEIYRIVYH